MRLIVVLFALFSFSANAQTKMDPALAEAIADAGCVISEQQLQSIVAKVGLERTFDKNTFYDLFSRGELLPIVMVHKAYARPEGYFEIISKYTGEGQLGFSLCLHPSVPELQ